MEGGKALVYKELSLRTYERTKMNLESPTTEVHATNA